MLPMCTRSCGCMSWPVALSARPSTTCETCGPRRVMMSTPGTPSATSWSAARCSPAGSWPETACPDSGRSANVCADDAAGALKAISPAAAKMIATPVAPMSHADLVRNQWASRVRQVLVPGVIELRDCCIAASRLASTNVSRPTRELVRHRRGGSGSGGRPQRGFCAPGRCQHRVREPAVAAQQPRPGPQPDRAKRQPERHSPPGGDHAAGRPVPGAVPGFSLACPSWSPFSGRARRCRGVITVRSDKDLYSERAVVLRPPPLRGPLVYCCAVGVCGLSA